MLVTDLLAGDSVQVSAGGLADLHTLNGKSTVYIAQIALMLICSRDRLLDFHNMSPHRGVQMYCFVIVVYHKIDL